VLNSQPEKRNEIKTQEKLIPAIIKAILTISLIVNVVDIDSDPNLGTLVLHPGKNRKRSLLIFDLIKE